MFWIPKTQTHISDPIDILHGHLPHPKHLASLDIRMPIAQLLVCQIQTFREFPRFQLINFSQIIQSSIIPHPNRDVFQNPASQESDFEGMLSAIQNFHIEPSDLKLLTCPCPIPDFLIELGAMDPSLDPVVVLHVESQKIQWLLHLFHGSDEGVDCQILVAEVLDESDLVFVPDPGSFGAFPVLDLGDLLLRMAKDKFDFSKVQNRFDFDD